MTSTLTESINFISIYKSDFAETYYDPLTECFYFKWLKFSPSNVFRDIFDKATPEILKARPQRILLDKRRVKIIAPADQIWLIEDWYVRMQSTNRSYRIAFVDSDDLFGKLSVKNIAAKINFISRGTEAKVFKQAGEAQQWLNQ
jgi:hypothetical protein